MNKLLILVCLLFLISCERKKESMIEENRIITARGLEGKPEAIFFISENEGYSFNTLQIWPEVSKDELKTKTYLPSPREVATIFKTTNKGETWEKYGTMNDRSFSQQLLFHQNTFYTFTKNFQDNELYLFKKNLVSGISEEYEIESGYALLEKNDSIYFTSQEGIINVSSFSPLNSSQIKTGNISCILNNNIFTFLRDEKGNAFLAMNNIEDGTLSTIDLPITPYDIKKYNDTTLLIAGKLNDQGNSVILAKYDLVTKTVEELHQFQDYTIVTDLKLNNHIICGFVGNSRNGYNEYDLFYSLDKGRTWYTQVLSEGRSIRPSNLTKNILFIYGGKNRIQKIKFSE